MGRSSRHRKFYAGLVAELVRFAEFEFKNGRRLSDGATEGDHKGSVTRQLSKFFGKTKDVAEEIFEKPPHFPSELSYLWTWYRQHSMGLAVNGMAPATVTWEGVESWARLLGIKLEPWEAVTMVHLGLLKANIESEKINSAAKQK